MTIFRLFTNQMLQLPLLESYWCTFESMSGEELEPDLNDLAKNVDDCSVDILLLPNGKLVARRSAEGDEGPTIPVKLGRGFRLVLKSFPRGPETRIPFTNGRIREDTREWKISKQNIFAEVRSITPSGFVVRIDESMGFLPKSFTSKAVQENPNTIIGMFFECEVVKAIGRHPPAVKPIGPFIFERQG